MFYFLFSLEIINQFYSSVVLASAKNESHDFFMSCL